jgi:serine/threonine protein kinase
MTQTAGVHTGSLIVSLVGVCASQWTVDKAADAFLQLACGVKHIHSCGVLHRDLKSDNALIAGLMPLVVKWADFGCSVKLEAGDSTYGQGGSRLRVKSFPDYC